MLHLNFSQSAKSEYKLLCLGAHCDDIEIGCGGTLLKLIENYNISFVKWVVFASTEERAKEAKASAELFLDGVKEKDIVVHQYRDGFLGYSGYEIKDNFEMIKKEFSPDVVFTHYRNDRHQDHRLLSDLAWNTFRNHFILEYEIPKYDGDLGIPNLFVTLDSRLAEKKIDILLKSFASQANKHWFDRETFLALMRLRGMECATESKYAEAFHARKVLVS
jgi:LmbE family N-acetylglucosaminyl deacetylase